MARKRTIRDEDLLEAARGAFVERGFAVSTKEIAMRAGVSEGVLFQRFGTKADLFFASMAPPKADLGSELAQPIASAKHVEKIGLMMLDYFRSAVPVLLPLVSHPAFRFEDFAERNPNAGLVTMRRETMHYFASIGAVDPSGSALSLMAATYGVAMFEKLGAHGGQMPDEHVRRMLRRVWVGCEVVIPTGRTKKTTG